MMHVFQAAVITCLLYVTKQLPLSCRPRHCNFNQTFSKCTGNGGYDSCIDCPENYINCDPIYTGSDRADQLVEFGLLDQVCTPLLPCLKGSILKSGNICDYKQNNDYCMCDRENFYYGTDWRICNSLKDEKNFIELTQKVKQKGMELKQSGHVGPCSPGFYKDRADNSICKRWTRCSPGRMIEAGTPISDTVCRTESYRSFTVTTNTTSDTVPNTQSDLSESSKLTLYIVVSAICLVIFTISIVCAIRRRCMSDDQDNHNCEPNCIQTKKHRERGSLEVIEMLQPTTTSADSEQTQLKNRQIQENTTLMPTDTENVQSSPLHHGMFTLSQTELKEIKQATPTKPLAKVKPMTKELPGCIHTTEPKSTCEPQSETESTPMLSNAPTESTLMLPEAPTLSFNSNNSLRC